MIELQLQNTAFGWGGARTPDDLTVRAVSPSDETDLYLSIQDLFVAHGHIITESEANMTLGTNVLFECNPTTDTVRIISGSFNVSVCRSEFLEELESVMDETFDEIDESNSEEERTSQLQAIQESLSKSGFTYDVIDQYENMNDD